MALGIFFMTISFLPGLISFPAIRLSDGVAIGV